ncbi:MAG: hypothetical protein LBR32_04155 [Propionibacteriaceae bacterium]|jgi:hypothetical protein|nr:hypothetical protein [Propionibacteriaceae bacterium]
MSERLRLADTSAAANVERIIFVGFLVIRGGVVIQTLTATILLVSALDIPPAYTAIAVVATLWSVWLAVRHRRPAHFASAPAWELAVDWLIALATIVCAGQTMSGDRLIGTWDAWFYAWITAATPTFAVWPLSRRVPPILAVGVAAVYIVTCLPSNRDIASTVFINAGTPFIFALVGAAICSMLRQLAATTDENVRLAADLAVKLERERHWFHTHNVTGLLTRLAESDTPKEILPHLRQQALFEANRLRADMDHHEISSPFPETGSALSDVCRLAARGFGHLPIDLRTALARQTRVSQGQALVVYSAVVTALYNVQFHAGRVSQVVVHADNRDGRWEVSVCDDGDGFDAANTKLGFGLEQVVEQARGNDIAVEITSAPGEGTCVYLRGAAPNGVAPE